MKKYEIIKKCLLCQSDLKKILSLGKTPLANDFLDIYSEQDLFSLNLMQCQSCSHVQLDTLVNEDILYKHYLYVSGTSKTNVKHFENYANQVLERFFKSSDTNQLIIDIGSNDGTFLKFFHNKVKCLGIDPAENLIDEITSQYTLPIFFHEKNLPFIKERIAPLMHANIITCNNMFAHNKDLSTIVSGVKQLLHPQGTFIFENSYLLDMINNNIFDVIYHEHMHHHHLIPLIKFFDKFDMKIYDVERLPNHGGSIRVYVCHKSNNLPISNNVQQLLQLEKNINSDLTNFANKVLLLKQDLIKLIKQIKRQKQNIGIFGYPAKATTFFYGLNLNPNYFDFVVDSATLKQNKYVPGGNYLVHPPDYMYQQNPDYMLILGWNFADSIINNHKNYQGKWIVPLPELKII